MVERPAHVPEDRVCPFDPHQDAYAYGDPFEVYEQFRGAGLRYSPLHGGFWIASDAATIREVFQHPDVFSSRNTSVPAGDAWPRKLIPIEIDPPLHGKYRQLLAPVFSPASMAKLEEPVRSYCGELVDELVGSGACDFVLDFARRFPTGIFIEFLFGFPRDMTEQFVTWNYTLLHGETPEARREQGAELIGFLTEAIADRAEDPVGADLVSHMLRSQIDGRPVTTDEVLDTSFLMFMAGLDTVTTSLSFAFRFLADNPEHRRQLIEHPEITPTAVEELLRYHSFVSPTRTVTTDTEFHGVVLKEGDRIHLPGVIAGRDSDEFVDPNVVDFERAHNRHLAFGAGPHRCLGSHLARRELVAALDEWHRRIPDYEIDPIGDVTFHAGTMVGLNTVPLRWSPVPVG